MSRGYFLTAMLLAAVATALIGVLVLGSPDAAPAHHPAPSLSRPAPRGEPWPGRDELARPGPQHLPQGSSGGLRVRA